MAVTSSDLEGYVGKNVDFFCENKFISPEQNHCAHFVSHALGIKIGTLCGDMGWKTRKTGATIRVDELYNGLSNTGVWASHPICEPLLIFITRAANVKNNIMANVPQKHVGVYFGGAVYNFSNSGHKVVKDTSPDTFLAKFQGVYRGDDLALFYGEPP